MKSFLPWLGGKSQLAPHIASILNGVEHTCYCEVFMGASHVFFRKTPSKAETLNDINRDLTNLFRILQNHLEEFHRYFKWALCSRDEFARLKSMEPQSLTDIQRAVRFYYLQKMCFGGHTKNQSYGTSTTSPPRLNLLRIEEELSQVHLRLSRVNIETLDWKLLVKKYDRPHTLFYLDPPYHGNEADYGNNLFARSDFEKMAKMLASIQGNFLLSLNDNKEVRKIFKRFNLENVSVRYSVGKSKSKKYPELLISNLDLSAQKAS